MPLTVEEWVKAEYRREHCNEQGHLKGPMNMDVYRNLLHAKRPKKAQEITAALKTLGDLICEEICARFPRDQSGHFTDKPAVVKKLREMRTELKKDTAKVIVYKIQKQNIERKSQACHPSTLTLQAGGLDRPQNSTAQVVINSHESEAMLSNSDSLRRKALEEWIQDQYLTEGFKNDKFLGFTHLKNKLIATRPHQTGDIRLAVNRLRKEGRFEDPLIVEQARAAQRNNEGGVSIHDLRETHSVSPGSQLPLRTDANPRARIPGAFPTSFVAPEPSTSGIFRNNAPGAKNADTTIASGSSIGFENRNPQATPADTLTSREVKQLALQEERSARSHEESSDTGLGSEGSDDEHSIAQYEMLSDEPDFEGMDSLSATKLGVEIKQGRTDDSLDAQIRHSPLLSGNVIQKSTRDLLPQYGFLGNLADNDNGSKDSKVFLNTNIPFSAFICGVQGSGKSHTTSCILENALVRSNRLGRIEAPVSALVFSYGEFSGNGAGFSLSEAAFLASPHTDFPEHPCVRKITVLTSPSNPSIRKLYNRLPNVTAIPFKLKAASLDIGAMLTLMAVNESATIPLYMATVESILRDLATESEDGGLNYREFKERLKLCDFNPAQLNMLEMRLGLLESFIDMEGNSPQPSYHPGEITIVDLSCPFVTANTACILFKLALQQFLQSRTPGKMVVLDEAHKYMLNTPSAKSLTDYLIAVIRLQRHHGVRVVIATQEPTLLTDLIALCSVTVIHRFSSPQWLTAIKKHIPISDPDILQQIEDLERGTALVYAPHAVLGRDEDGGLMKGIGRLLKLDVRKRVTADGGQSILAV